ncbi:MAG: glycosyltransferase [Planctomycetota bacterium]
MRVALVHETLAGIHGSERVLLSLAELYPDAPIFVTIHQTHVTRGTTFEGRDIRASFLDRLPWLRNRHRLLLPLMPYAVEQHDMRGFDVIISSHHAAAHGVLTRADQLHLCYTHSPARYAWDLYPEHLPPSKRSPLKRYALHRFRQWDASAGLRVDEFAANSKHVARRIRKTYRRDARVIYPPVDTARFRHDREREDFYLVAGRMVKYKNVDVILEAFRSGERKLVVAGDGPESKRLRKRAGSNVRWLGPLKDSELADQLERCRALVFAGEEDFGMVPVEAMAAGAPVIALGRGGVTETVTDGETGVFFDQPTPEAVRAAVERFEQQGVTAGPGELQCSAQRFGVERFEREIRDWVAGAWQRFNEQ